MSDARTSRPAGHGPRAAERFDAVRRAARQEQFLEVVSADEARARFARHVDASPLAGEQVTLAQALGRVLADDVYAPIDVPPFDRSNVDGFALRAVDTIGATDTVPRRLTLNPEVIVCGHAPTLPVSSGSATTIATGGLHRRTPRCRAGTVRVLCRLRYRARRNRAAAGRAHRLA
jgi:hypothetical protein